MEAQKSLIKNIALFLFIGAIPSIGWASGYFSPFSWASLFLLLSGIFCILWLKERQNKQTLRHILLTRTDAWALCEGDQIIDRSPSFPAHSLQDFKEFLHPHVLPEVETAIHELIFKNSPFKIKIHSTANNAIYSLEGEPLKGQYIFWLQNITESTYLERLNAENLQKNETLIQKLQSTLDMLPFLVWTRDQDQHITYCNVAYSEAVRAASQIVQREGLELIPARTAKILARKALHTNENQLFEGTLFGEEAGKNLRIIEIPTAAEKETLGVAFDISELKAAHQEIQNLVDAHDEVLAHLSTAIAIYDASGTLQYYNQAYVNLNNFDEEFLKTHPRLDEVLEELRGRRQLPEYADFPAYKKKCLLQLTEQMEPREEMMHLPDERTLRNFSAPHPMGGLLFMYEDVTNYLSLERHNKTLFNSYQATLDNLFEGVIVIGSNNRVEIVNPSFCRLWNFREEDVTIDQHLNQVVEKLKDFLVYQEDWEIYKAQFIESVTDRVPKTGQLKRRDGVILNFGYVPLPNGSHLLSYVDITDTCLVQQALQEKSEALETADVLKSEFIESVSYEFKSPLNTIIGFSEVLKNKYFGELNEKQNNYVEGVLDASTKLLSLVNDILDLASIEAGHLALNPSVVDIPKLLQDIIQVISKMTEQNNQHIILKCNNIVHNWVVDERRLKQVLLNLLSNAMKFTPFQGKITIEANIIHDELFLSVTDTGVGLAVDEQILNKFERGKADREAGSGIGLSLVKNLIELHGGRVELFSEINKGTTVCCFLPRIFIENQITEEIACLGA